MLKSLKKQNTVDLIWELFRTDFKLKYNDSVLGFLWVLMKPFSIFLIMYFVLSRVFVNNSMENFSIYLLIGNVFMTLWSDGTVMGMDSLLNRAGLITKVNFPRYVVLISSTAIAIVNFLINSIIVAIFMIAQNVIPSITHVLWFFFCSVLLYVLILVVSMVLSIVYVRFRDIKQMWELFNQLLFWSTPVFYSVDAVAGKGGTFWSDFFFLILTKINPISVLLTSGRSGLLKSDIILQSTVFVWCLALIVFWVLAYFYYKKTIKKIAEYF